MVWVSAVIAIGAQAGPTTPTIALLAINGVTINAVANQVRQRYPEHCLCQRMSFRSGGMKTAPF